LIDDRTELEAPGEPGVVEHRLHQCLGVVETTLDRDGVDVGREHRRHLAALHVGHAALGVEHEDVDAVPPGNRIDRRAAGVARRRADDRQMRIAAGEELLEQQPEQLERHVLERQGRSMEQLEQPVALVELYQRRHRGMREPAIGLGAQRTELVLAQVAGDERQHHPYRRLDIGEPGQLGDLLAREARPGRGHI
jgi:hypothetical protein